MTGRRRNKTSQPRFNLEGSPTSKSPQLIYFIYRYKKNQKGDTIQLKYSTGKKIRRKNWDNKTYRAKAGVSFPQPEVDSLNRVLRRLEDRARELVRDDPEITILEFKRELDYEMGYRKRPRSKSEYSLLEFVEIFIEKSNNHPRTIQKYTTAKNHIEGFQDHRGKMITFDQVNPEFVEHFQNWLYEYTSVKSQNTVSKLIQNLKEFMRDAHANSYHSNTAYLSPKFKVSRVPTDKVYLELEDLNRMLHHDFEQSDVLAKVRDLWLIAAYSGLRYSDFSRLKEEHFVKYEDIELIQINTYKGRKTKYDTEVVIPILPQLRGILEKYDFNPPNPFPGSGNLDILMNRKIKEVCKQAGIDRVVTLRKSSKGRIVEKKSPLFKEVASHSARYTFINIMLNDFGIIAQDLAKITGQSIKVLESYDRRDKKKTAIKVYSKILKAKK